MTGIGGLTGTFLALSFKWVTDFRLLIIVLFLLAGIIGWSRLRMKAHRPVEIYIGYGTGFLLMFLIFYLL
jgi:membrane-associated phospholipid phosphatase